jgi:hypothetical protein
MSAAFENQQPGGEVLRVFSDLEGVAGVIRGEVGNEKKGLGR